MVREVPLTKGFVALVDDADYDRVVTRRWHARKNSNSRLGRHYACTRRLASDGGRRGSIDLQRFILEAPAGTIVDHVNRDPLDCRRANLRFATASQNSANAEQRPSPHGYRGVRLRKTLGYFACVRFKKKEHRTPGFYPTAKEAAAAYDDLARRFHGEYAFVNFPDGGA